MKRCGARRSCWIFVTTCLLYLFFLVSQHRDRRSNEEQHAHGFSPAHSEDANLRKGAKFALPTRANVVYITLKPRRDKPTIRPKQKKPEIKSDYKSIQMLSSIRVYSQTLPPWISTRDLSTMRFLADTKVLGVKKLFQHSEWLLMFESETGVSGGNPCGISFSPTDNTQVFAFHLDRVLGLNRSIPTVSRKLHDGQACPVVLWDALLYPEGLAANVKFTWGEYQNSLKRRCWEENIRPKFELGCSSVHHHEWSKLALFDFLLQIHRRLDASCCGFRPRREDGCVESGHRAACGDQSNIPLQNIVHRNNDPRHLVFTNNKGSFDRAEDNLDFKLLEGIKEFPERAVSVLRSGKLREKLLQSLFLDQIYWESQGGRRGVDKLIDVVEKRAKVFLTYINAHRIKTTPMNV